jgi:hypothetical protein
MLVMSTNASNIQYVQVKDISAAFGVSSDRVIEVLKGMKLYMRSALSYDSYIRYSDTIDIFQKMHLTVVWNIVNERLSEKVVKMDSELYPERKTTKSNSYKTNVKINGATKQPGIPKTAADVQAQKRLPNDFKRGGLTQ